ncbi:MAG: acetate--CoA ligase family protein [Pseudomonadota bacterium]
MQGQSDIPPTQDLATLLFAPRRIALVGLSNDPTRPSGRPLRFLRRAGFKGEIHIVNPRRDTVQGEPAYPSLDALPARPDHAYILLGTDLAETAVADCARLGVPVATVLADGFAEAGDGGRARQRRLVDVARTGGTRLLGPNSMGVADLHTGCWLTVNAIYDEPDHPAGRTALISQSGSMMGSLVSRAKALGLGFSRVAAVGNEADLGVAEIIHACLDDPNTDVITLFIETVRNADALARAAARAADVGKPVLAYKLGRSKLGQEMAVAHTGALLSEDAVADAFLRDIGIARISTLDGLVEAPVLFRGRRPSALTAARIGVVTTTGGGSATVSDRLALEGITIQPPAPETLAAVRGTGLSVVDGPVIDLTMAGVEPKFVRAAVEAVAADPKVDMVLSVSGSSGRSAPEKTEPPLVEADVQGKPLTAFITPDAPESLTRLLAAGIPAFRTPESAADVIGAFCRWRAPRITALAREPCGGIGRPRDEQQALAFLAQHGVPTVQTATIAPGESPDLPFPYPVALKVLSAYVPHKTEAGGVVLNIADPEALRAAGLQIKTSVEASIPDVTVDALICAPMIRPVQEVLVGYRNDGQIGPTVTLAPGGVMVGLHEGDKAVRLAPVDLATAHEMIAEVRGLAPLRGHRGQLPGDIGALAAIIVAMSDLARHETLITEAEANPVMVTPDGAMAADALVLAIHGRITL